MRIGPQGRASPSDETLKLAVSRFCSGLSTISLRLQPSSKIASAHDPCTRAGSIYGWLRGAGDLSNVRPPHSLHRLPSRAGSQDRSKTAPKLTHGFGSPG